MDYQQSDESSEKISELLEKINKWLEKTNKSLKYNSMNDQQLYESSEKISDLMEKLDKGLEKQEDNKRLEEETNEIPKSSIKKSISQLEELLYKMAENAKEMANTQGIAKTIAKIFHIKESRTSINLYCKKLDDGSIGCDEKFYTIKSYIYNKYGDDKIYCNLDSEDLPSKIECIHYYIGSDKYISKSFKLSDSLQSISFREGIKEKILDAFDISFPGVLENLNGEQYIVINVDASIDPNNPIEANPKISKHKVDKYSGKFIYDDGRSFITIYWSIIDPSKLKYF
jgi:hypothetical protein